MILCVVAEKMAVLKRNGSANWLIEFTYLGETVRRSSGTPSKSQARELEAEWRRQIHDRVKAGKAPSITLGEAIDRYYLTVLEPDGKPDTLKAALYSLNQIRTHFGPDRRLDQITQAEVAAWRDKLLTEKGLSAGGANRLYAWVRAIVNLARDDWNVAAPTFRLKMLKEPRGRVRYLTDEEEARLLGACAPHLRDIVTFIMDSGARRAEMRGLLWSDVRFEGDRAVVAFRATETKSGKARQVPLPVRSTELLRRLRKPLGEKPRTLNIPVFLSPVRSLGGKLKAGADNRTAFQAACRRAGIEDFRLHDLRHHYASRLARRGVSLQQIGGLLGHASIKMTERYAHLVQSDLDRAVALLDPPDLPAAAPVLEPATIRRRPGWFSIRRAIHAMRGRKG